MENDPVVALDLEGIVIGMAEDQAQVALAATVRLAGPSFDAALPDVDALDGRTVGLAAALWSVGCPSPARGPAAHAPGGALPAETP